MRIEESDFIDVMEKAEKLKLNKPSGISLLPRNFDIAESKEELLHENEEPTVRILFRNAGIEETRLEPSEEKINTIGEKDFLRWIGPTIFTSYSVISENLYLISTALSVIANYITDFLKGVPSHLRNAKLDIIIEKKIRRTSESDMKVQHPNW